MIHPDTYVGNTNKGLGLFAKRRFERGEILWIMDDIDVQIPLAQYLVIDGLQRQKLAIYSYLDNKNRVIIPWDEGKYVNHSCTPNSTGLQEIDNISVALRTIEADEEIVEDYDSYYGHFETFVCRCGAPTCRGIIAQDDAYRPDLRLPLAMIAPAMLNRPQRLLSVQSAENDDFRAMLHGYTVQKQL